MSGADERPVPNVSVILCVNRAVGLMCVKSAALFTRVDTRAHVVTFTTGPNTIKLVSE